MLFVPCEVFQLTAIDCAVLISSNYHKYFSLFDFKALQLTDTQNIIR